MSELVTFDMLWKIIDTSPFVVPLDMDWDIEFGEPTPNSFLTFGTSRIATRMRFASETGRYP